MASQAALEAANAQLRDEIAKIEKKEHVVASRVSVRATMSSSFFPLFRSVDVASAALCSAQPLWPLHMYRLGERPQRLGFFVLLLF